MLWSYAFGSTEVLIVLLFSVFYILYGVRIILARKILRCEMWKPIVKLVLRTLAVSCIIIALLGPSFGDIKKKEVAAIGKDIYILLDVSKSMDGQDIKPSRLMRTKFQMRKIISSFKSDRLGLIMFSSNAFVQCPLTYDHSNLNLWLETLNTNLITPSGTDFGAALELAIEKFNKDESSKSSKKKSKVIILVSDGEDFGGKSKDAAEKANENGISLYTLGIGTKKGIRIKKRNGYKLDRDGKEVISKLNPEALKEIARIAEGEYFEISNQRDDTNRLIATIEGIDGRLMESKEIDTQNNKYYYFVALALFFLSLDFLVKFRIFAL